MRMCEFGCQEIGLEGFFYGAAKTYFESLGIQHVSFDLNAHFGSLPVDLGEPIEESQHIGQYDIVTNFGTSEHVPAQYECFENAHRICAVGGQMVHVVPAPGNYPGHGCYTYTPEFFEALGTANGYSIIRARKYVGPPGRRRDLATAIFCKESDRPFMSRASFDELPLVTEALDAFVGDYEGDSSIVRRALRVARRELFFQRGRATVLASRLGLTTPLVERRPHPPRGETAAREGSG
jgi:hypothetical protein